MRYTLIFTFLLASLITQAQTTNPYALWEDQQNSTYYVVQIDPANGTKTNLYPIAGMSGLVIPGTTTIDVANNEFVCIGMFGGNPNVVRVNLSTGQVNNAAVTGNVIGLEYNCMDQKIYALYDDNDDYNLITLNTSTGAKTIIGNIPGVDGHFGGMFSLNPDSNTYVFQAVQSTTYNLLNVDLATGAIKHQNLFSHNTKGMEYSCATDSIYCLIEDQQSGAYFLAHINPITGSLVLLDSLDGVDGMVQETHSIDPSNGQYTFMGFAGPTPTMFAVDVTSVMVVDSGKVNGFQNAAGFEFIPCCGGCAGSGPLADFNYTVNGLVATFTDMSTGATSYHWDFGDGNSDTTANPVHTFSQNGTYNVCLTVSDSCGSDTICDSVAVLCLPPVSFFGVSPGGLTVTFKDSSNGATSWHWDFGDGNTDTTQNTTHTYGGDGTYFVCLTVSNPCGSDTSCDSITVQAVGIGERHSNGFQIYPNPSHGKFKVRLDRDARMVVSDIVGKHLMEMEVRADHMLDVDISQYGSGVFFIRLRDRDGREYLKKILVE